MRYMYLICFQCLMGLSCNTKRTEKLQRICTKIIEIRNIFYVVSFPMFCCCDYGIHEHVSFSFCYVVLNYMIFAHGC